MSSLTFSVAQDKADRLAAAAREVGVPAEELLRKMTDEFLDRKSSFESAAQYVLQKECGALPRVGEIGPGEPRP